jgi:UDP-N-acetylglucosamine/UDP-N-acetylgalactosamine diphosphorylase
MMEHRKKLSEHGQEHLLRFWDELDDAARRKLAGQIEAVDFALIEQLYRGGGSQVDWAELARRAVAPPAFRLDASKNRFSPEEARAAGRAALERGEVGALLVAGGQGTRLGFEHPKGMYPVGPVSGASLFQMYLEKLRAIARRYGRAVPLYLMTSPATHDETVAYLEQHARFGFPKEDLIIFRQGTMPAVDAETGKLLLAERDELFQSPDGHGGTVAALAASGALDDMRRRGLKRLFYFQVDNPLTPICDPEFLGYHLLSESELSTLAVAKQLPEERVGNVVSIDGKVQIIDYRDLPREAAERRAADGSLELWAGNTAIHVFEVEFLARATRDPERLPFHVAKKAVPHLDAEGNRVEPSEPNALKFERFIFDLLPSAERAIVVEADPRRAFAPLKNAPGAERDTPEAAREQLVATWRTWFAAAGVETAEDVAVEVSPLFALDAEEFAAKVEPGRKVSEPTYFR